METENNPGTADAEILRNIRNNPGAKLLEAMQVLREAVSAGVLKAAGNERVYLMFEEDTGATYYRTYTFEEAAQDLVESGSIQMLKDAIADALAYWEAAAAADFSFADAYADVVAYLKGQDETYFTDRERTKWEALNDAELLNRLASEHHHCVSRFGNDREWSCKDACDNEPGIRKEPIPRPDGTQGESR